jgi:riboflavin kinase/FMN adenylyltransferase
MRVWRSWPEAGEFGSGGCALTIGAFDGVHRGHQALVARLVDEGRRRSLRAAVLTFEDMPFFYFRPQECAPLLSLAHEKIRAFEPLHIDDLLVVPFDASVAEQHARDFAREILVGQLRIKYLLIGPDFALGKNRSGTAASLTELGQEFGFEVEVLREKVTFGGEAISSTRTRGAIEEGHLKTARDLLGRPFELEGRVVSGQQIGRTIGVPTINIAPHPRKALPAHGVYACRAQLGDDETWHAAALNIGMRPTVGGLKEQIEFHVLDQDIPTPPETARLQILERLRDEHRFGSLDELKEQMQRDFKLARRVLETG